MSPLKERDGNPIKVELDAAMKRIGELTMENELMRMRFDKNRPLAPTRSKR
jgi:transposase